MGDSTKLKHVLFVDDEPHLLAGLKRSLRTQRNQWDMHFAESGAVALRLMQDIQFDAVVSDMRMPGMDGVQLLKEVVRQQPNTIRIVLSGQSDEASIMNLVSTTHQFLSKPCEVDTLIAVLSRAFALQNLLMDEKIRGLVSQLDSLPSLPMVYIKLQQKLRSEDTTLREIGHLIGEDPAITSKLLQVVNSAYFGIGRHITNPEEAASFLGMETLKGLILTAGVFRQFEVKGEAVESFSLQDMWRHSIAVGRLARDIARMEGCDKETVDDALAAGLLHDVGLLLLAYRLPAIWDEIHLLMKQEKIPRWVAESQVTGVEHSAIGAYLLGLWGLPGTVIDAVAFNHRPMDSPIQKFSALAAVHVADALVRGDGRLNKAYLEALGVDGRLPEWQAMADNLSSEADI